MTCLQFSFNCYFNYIINYLLILFTYSISLTNTEYVINPADFVIHLRLLLRQA